MQCAQPKALEAKGFRPANLHLLQPGVTKLLSKRLRVRLYLFFELHNVHTDVHKHTINPMNMDTYAGSMSTSKE